MRDFNTVEECRDLSVVRWDMHFALRQIREMLGPHGLALIDFNVGQQVGLGQAERADRPRRPSAPTGSRSPGRLERILHVDNDADIRALAKLTLEALGGYRVESCESGADALAMAPGFRPDLLLLDVNMPVMDGPAARRALRKLPGCANVPAVFMTTRVQPHEIEALRSAGAVDVIAKPFDRQALSGQIAAIWQSAGAGAP